MWDRRIVVTALAAVALGAPFAAWLGAVVASPGTPADANPASSPSVQQVVPAQAPGESSTIDPTGGPQRPWLPAGPATPTGNASPTALPTLTAPPTTEPPASPTAEPPTGDPEPTLPLPTGTVLPEGGGQGAGGESPMP